MNSLHESIIKFHTLPPSPPLLPPPPSLCSIGNSNFKTASLYKKISEIEIEIRNRTSFRHGPLRKRRNYERLTKVFKQQRSAAANLTREKSFHFKVCTYTERDGYTQSNILLRQKIRFFRGIDEIY